MTSAVAGGGTGFPTKQTRKEPKKLILDSDGAGGRGLRVEKSEDFADVIYGSP